MRIAIDAMGGDFAPEPIVKGTLDALTADHTIEVVLVGDRHQVEPVARQSDVDQARIEYAHTTEVVGMDESPAKAMRGKPNSSINVCWKLLADGAVDGIISAGNTGAVVAGGLRTRRFLEKIQRPGIAVTMPSPNGRTVMLDVGANVHPKPEHLFQYGVMGSIFAKKMCGKENPTIGLLNVGSEEAKGNELAKETAALFNNSPIRDNFKGNVEGRDICRGLVDVIVCDGFVGNIVLKCCEGLVDFLMSAVGSELLGSLDNEKHIAQKSLLNLHSKYHHSEVGGAPLLGIDGVCLICHGGSDAKAIRSAFHSAKRFGEMNRLIVEELQVALS
ncbi:MAG: phosphate acyltransferase PlsX [Planctomycetota bacterium]